MADIRINSLPTTASASSSDDFLALDGATNGTRKLNAYSPTFGGNLTVSGGTGTIDATSGTASATLNLVGRSSGTAKTASVLANSAGSLVLGAEGAGSSLTIAANTGNTTVAYNLTVSGTGTSSVAGNLGIGTTSTSYKVDVNGSLVSTYTNNPALALLRSTDSQAANKGGGIYFGGVYSGTDQTEFAYIGGVKENGTSGNYAGKLVFGTRANGTGADDMTRMTLTSGGNLLIGTTTDGGQKLQVAGTGYLSDSLRVGASWSPLAWGVKAIEVNDAGGGLFAAYYNGTAKGYIVANSGDFAINTQGANSLLLRTNGTTAVTLDSSQNATFAGKITAGTWASGTAEKLQANTTVNNYAGFFANTASSGNGYALRLHTNGTTSGDYPLYVSSGAGAGSLIFGVTGDGNATFAGKATATRLIANSQWVAASAGTGALSATANAGVQLTGTGAVNDITLVNKNGDNVMVVPTGTTNATFSGAIAIGNTVNTVSPTSPNRTITMVIGGTTYYIHAKTTND